MSEKILRALTQLFAIITKQDGGVTAEERNYVKGFFEMELDKDSVIQYISLYDKLVGYDGKNPKYLKSSREKRADVRDTLQTLNISKKINQTLSQKQKVIVLLRLLELLKADNQLTPLGVEIIDTISAVFNIPATDYNLLKIFVKFDSLGELDDANFLVTSKNKDDVNSGKVKWIHNEINGYAVIVRVSSVNMYFIKYRGVDEIILNGFIMNPSLAYLFSPGSTIKAPGGGSAFYSDISGIFESISELNKITFDVDKVIYYFPNKTLGLHEINISEKTGSLVGIMGSSGSGKTTLLNVLAGIIKPSSGSININNLDYSKRKNELDGVVGYVAQDDILIEELTVYQNLFYNGKLCLNHLTEKDLDERVLSTLNSLGLEQTRDLKVGSVLSKTISGGQRKRLNIALELIREPSVLFVDEPTSGLSSRDSENVMDLLKELSQKGKIIFVVIHQPSSDIFKMFDKLIVMDTGGFMIYYGNPIEAISYFKEATKHLDRLRSICHLCGNVNPEQIFNIVEARIVNEYGQFTNKRKITPTQWSGLFDKKYESNKVESVTDKPPKSLSRPSLLKQMRIFTTRDFLSKISDRQYLLLNILEAPLLAVVLATVVRYRNNTDGTMYVFRFNENIPAFLLMSIIVALFLGLTVSAEEIIRDRKLLKREQFLHLSWSSYLTSKMILLFGLSAIQTLSFVMIGNAILEIQGMTPAFWLILFSTSCMANMMGLNISSAFRSAVTVYIMIPIILIPQLIFSGLMFNFDKLNESIRSYGKVPLVADVMTSRWALEAMAVYQFLNNEYEEPYYEFDQKIRQSDYKSSFWIPAMRSKSNFIANNFYKKNDSLTQIKVKESLYFFIDELNREPHVPEIDDFVIDSLTYKSLSPRIFLHLNQYLNKINEHYTDISNLATRKKEKLVSLFESDERYTYNLNDYKDIYFNESLSDLVRNINIKDRILVTDNRFIQQVDPIFHLPEKIDKVLTYRTHFYAPQKYLFGTLVPTLYFNILAIWTMSILLFITVYFKIPKKVIAIFGKH